MRRIALLLVLALGIATTLPAQPINLLSNPAFDGGLTPWTLTPAGAWTIDNAEGSSAGSGLPSASCTATDPDVCTIGQCISLAGNTGQTMHSWSYASRNVTNVASITTGVTFYPTADCTGFGQVRDFSTIFFPAATWTVDDRMATAEAGELSAWVELSFSTTYESGNSFTVKVDDVTFIGNPPPPFFGDDFESGDTSKWSTTGQ